MTNVQDTTFATPPSHTSPIQRESPAPPMDPPLGGGSRRRVIEVSTQSTQDLSDEPELGLLEGAGNIPGGCGVDVTGYQGKPPPPLGLNHKEVQGDHRGMGVHVLDFANKANPCIREPATPPSHYARRQRGPEVAAEGLVLRNPDRDAMREVGESADERVWAATPDPVVVREPTSATESVLRNEQAVGGFVKGGFLRTVPAEGSVESHTE